MIKTRYDHNLAYKKFCCHVCGEELFRTIENVDSRYGSPSFIIHCKECRTKHYIKYTGDEIEFDIFHTERKIEGKYIKS